MLLERKWPGLRVRRLSPHHGTHERQRSRRSLRARRPTSPRPYLLHAPAPAHTTLCAVQGGVDLTFLETGELPAEGLSDSQFDALVDTVAGTPVKVDVVMKMMGLWHTRNTVVGNELLRGVSGGERHRITTAEMLVGPRRIFMMDEISTGAAPHALADVTASQSDTGTRGGSVRVVFQDAVAWPFSDTIGDAPPFIIHEPSVNGTAL